MEMSSTAAALPLVSSDIGKKRRRPAGTPDPDAEVVSLPPQTLLESDRYVCEICSQVFQREQNLQMHRRRHKVPWKLLKKETAAAGAGGVREGRKRVYVCPEPSCLHHEPGHALGDLVGIKKHFRRKHSDRRQWVCERCDKGYAVQSDYKAHLKTCGTRGHTCDCGRVFSRVESFIEHQDACAARGSSQPACLSRTGSSSSPSTDTDSNAAAAAPTAPPTWPNLGIPSAMIRSPPKLELQLLPAFTSKPNTSTTTTTPPSTDEAAATQLQLSLAPAVRTGGNADRDQGLPSNQLRVAAAEKALADEARRQAKRQLELAQQEFADATRIRRQAQAELDKAYALRNDAAKSISSILQVTCHECKSRLCPTDNSLASSVVSDGDGGGGERSRNSV